MSCISNVTPGSTTGLRFVRQLDQVIGAGQHRSGWPYAVGCLRPLAAEQGILFDDFVEHRFCYNDTAAPHREPWIGVFHHPPNLPSFASENEKLPVMFEKRVWKESQRFLQGAIALSQYLADYLSATLHVPTLVVRHPSEIPRRTWSEAAYQSSSSKWLLQVGWYLRNTRAIYHVPPLSGHRKLRLWPPPRPPLHWVRDYDERVIQYWRSNGERGEWNDVTNYPLVSPERYDELLATHVILTEVFDASANNVVIECIVRNTPLVVNRHPAVIEYLGAAYPLYFDKPHEIPELLLPDRILAAHHYLSRLDKSPFQGEVFQESIAAAVRTIMADSARPVRAIHE